LTLAAALFTSSDVLAQALPNLNSLRVGYNTRKATARPEGELKAQIDRIDAEIATATRLGRLGDVRRLFAKGNALLAGRPWGEADEYQASLAIRTDRMVADSTVSYRVRLEQIFAPAIELTRPLSARVELRPRVSPAGRGGAPGASGRGDAPASPPPIALGAFDGVARDLRESPFPFTLDLTAVSNGTYALVIEVRDQDRVLGVAILNIAVSKGLDARLRALGTAAAGVVADAQADLRYPADFIRKVNEGLVEIGQFNVANELAAAEAVAAAARAGRNPFAGKSGDFERHYVLEGAGEIMPYRVLVPKSYNAARPSPLIIALHGLGGTEDSMFDQYARRIPELAEQHGYLVAAPLGFRPDGFYGSTVVAGGDLAARRLTEFSEQDVMAVLRRMREQYRVDDARIYLMGHSMGAIGTWAIAAKHPDIWAALGPISGLGSPATMASMKHIPQFVVHGDNDPTVNVNGSRSMVNELRKLGGVVTYVEVPGGNHTDIAVPNLPPMFEFFNAHRKTVTASR
jgi:poly(3-hydroxybutyrate) depolymerase